MNDLEKKVEFLMDIVNMLEKAHILPKEVIERSRNRVKIKYLRDKGFQISIDEEKELEKCLLKELEFQNIFNERI